MRHRFRSRIAGDWQAVPRRVLAKHRGAARSRSVGSIGLFAAFFIFPAPYIYDIRDDGLPATIVDMNMANDLLTAATQLCQGLDLSGERALEFYREAAVKLNMV